MYNNIDGMLNDVPPRGRWYLETFMVATVVTKRKNNYNYTYIYIYMPHLSIVCAPILHYLGIYSQALPMPCVHPFNRRATSTCMLLESIMHSQESNKGPFAR